jgi:hypothetical protein
LDGCDTKPKETLTMTPQTQTTAFDQVVELLAEHGFEVVQACFCKFAA